MQAQAGGPARTANPAGAKRRLPLGSMKESLQKPEYMPFPPQARSRKHTHIHSHLLGMLNPLPSRSLILKLWGPRKPPV